MKKSITKLAVLLLFAFSFSLSTVFAQGYYGNYFTWIATHSSMQSGITVIDNANLNGYFDALFLFTPNFEPNYVYNNLCSGVTYTGANWAIYNEKSAGDSIPVRSAFNILVPTANGTLFTDTATSSNHDYALVDNPATNNNPNKLLFITHQFAYADGDYNNKATGVYYAGSNWYIFNEDDKNFKKGAVYNVFATDSGANAFVHQATASNCNGDWTVIDNPFLNGNPSATIIVTPNWDPGHFRCQVYDTVPIGVWYTGSNNWAIYNQNSTPIPDSACFNVLICDNIPTNINEHSANNAIRISPNPAINNLTIESPPQGLIEIFDIQGQLIKTLATTGNKTNIDVSAFLSGVYVVQMKTEKGVEVKKFIKE